MDRDRAGSSFGRWRHLGKGTKMNLEITGVQNAGDLERERVVLRASDDLDIGRYAVFMGKSGADGNVLSGHVPAAYWFPNKKIKSGDFVVLYSKQGTTSSKTNDEGRTSYFYYWGWKQPKWVPGTTAALVETSTWTYAEPIK